MGELLVPPVYGEVTGPLIFLAGPIQGAPNWHRDAITILQATPALHIASPRWSSSGSGKLSEQKYSEQIDWEHFHLNRAGENGVVLFWLAREVEHFCDRAYVQTSRFELGAGVTLHRWKGSKVIVGIEAGFSNARYLRKTIAKKAPGIPLCSTLKETCEAAVALATP